MRHYNKIVIGSLLSATLLSSAGNIFADEHFLTTQPMTDPTSPTAWIDAINYQYSDNYMWFDNDYNPQFGGITDTQREYNTDELYPYGWNDTQTDSGTGTVYNTDKAVIGQTLALAAAQESDRGIDIISENPTAFAWEVYNDSFALVENPNGSYSQPVATFDTTNPSTLKNLTSTDLTKIGADIEIQNRYFMYDNVLYNNNFSYNACAQNYKINFQPFYKYSSQNSTKDFFPYELSSFGASVSIDGNISEQLKSGIALTIGTSNQKYQDDTTIRTTRDAGAYAFSVYTKAKTSTNFTIYSSLNHSNANIDSEGNMDDIRHKYKGYYYSNYTDNILGYDFQTSKNIKFTPLAGVRLGVINVPSQNDAVNLASQYDVSGFTQAKYDFLLGSSISREIVRNNHDIRFEVHGMLSYNLQGNTYQSATKPKTWEIDNFISNDLIADIGGSLSSKSGNNEFVLSFDSSLAKEYGGYSIAASIKKNL